MRIYSWILVTIMLCSFTSFSQQKTIEHIVAKGENISIIAKQYNIKPTAIYELNPEAKKGIKFKSVLLIPTSDQNDLSASRPSSTSEILHEVLSKETLYGISKEYGVSVDDLYKANPSLERDGLKVGQKISIIAGNKSSKSIVKTEQVKKVLTPDKENYSIAVEGIEYEVLEKQTKYSIAKDYGIKVDLLEKANPILQTQELKIGQKIIIPVKKFNPNVGTSSANGITNTTVFENTQSKDITTSKPKIVEKVVKTTESFELEVLPKQTKYSIAKEYGITVADLDKANPSIELQGLKVGQKIIIPAKQKIPNLIVESKDNIQENKNIEIKVEEKVLPSVGVVQKDSSIHEVLPKETKYGIAKEHGVTISDLDKANPDLDKEGLKIGQKINIPAKETVVVVAEKEIPISKERDFSKTQNGTTNEGVVATPVIEDKIQEGTITHKVLVRETKYGIAKDYGISVLELERLNPKTSSKLIVGSLLIIQSPKNVDTAVTKGEFVAESIDKENDLNTYHDNKFVDRLISTASENIGVRYRMGGMSKDGFDCSGLMCTAYSAHDISLPRTSLEQSRYGQVIEIENAQKGDLIFFKTRGGRQINHVGMVVEVVDGDVKFIHASNSGVIISSIKESYYSKKVVQVNRVL